MSRQTHSHIFSVLLIIIVLVSGLGNGIVSAASAATATPTSGVQAGGKPQAWIDAAIDLDQFSPGGSLVVHFNTTMSPGSSLDPVLSWPAVEGVTNWDETQTVLTFKPFTSLDSKKTYTFFLNPSLRSTYGDTLENPPEWIVHVQPGPEVLSVSPEPGPLEQRYSVIEVRFDRDMKPSLSQEMLSIEPPVPFGLRWKDMRTLQIALERPFEPDQRYDLTLNGGNDENALFAADGTYLAEEYRWFYWQKPFEAEVVSLDRNTIGIRFNYSLDQKKSGLPFSISPELEGEWNWLTAKEIRFTAKGPIPSSQEYTVRLTQTLFDSQGFGISKIPALSFSGLPPVHLANPDITSSQYSDFLVAQPDVEAIRVEFDVPVDHASAEKAFSIEPRLPGKFQWEKGTSGSKEVLVYALSELLKMSTTYTVKIAPSVLDKQGNKIIVRPYEQSFGTDQWAYLSSSFGEAGANIQVVDANGPRKIQFAGGDDQISFAAYRFELMDFAKLYADHYHGRSWGSDNRDIPIPADLTPTATWKNISSRTMRDNVIEETTLPQDLAPGLYVLNMRHGKVLYDQLFLVVTSN
ncbi:MAG TPA: Ig-like domain-containing protein, partial [Anaerolineales bacterium]|nr:Ig-like domain-containing protein [Anaerolineales bacterium]